MFNYYYYYYNYSLLFLGRTLLISLFLIFNCFIPLQYVESSHLSHHPLLKASPQVLKHNGDRVTLAWYDIPDPQIDDYIGVYTTSLPSCQKEVSSINITQSGSWSQGQGVIKTPLVNMRTEYEFRYIRSYSYSFSSSASPPYKKILAQSNSVRFANVNEPTQIHISLGNHPSEMTIMWVTNSSQITPIVKYGNVSGHYHSSVRGSTTTYTQKDLCGSPAIDEGWHAPGFIHEVTLTGLKPGAPHYYYYRCGNEYHGWSSEYYFQTPPLSSSFDSSKSSSKSPSRPRFSGHVEIIAFGDMGVFGGEPHSFPESSETSFWIQDNIRKNHFGDLILHIGDISYASGYLYIWDLFMASIEPVASRIPYMVGVGNHELDWPGIGFRPSWGKYDDDSGGECGVAYNSRFAMPVPRGEQYRRNYWYSFDYGPIHFVFMSTEHNFTRGSEQFKWIRNDLKSVDRSKTPWIIFSGHRPMYSSGVKKRMIQDHFRNEIEPLLFDHHVDLALWGHIHAYERTCPVYQGKCAREGRPVHAVVGMAGNDHQVPWKDPQPKWSVFRSRRFGYSRIIVSRDELTFQYVADANHTVLDEFTIDSNFHR